MTKEPIIIDDVDVSECCQYMPRYMEDYDIDTLDYCGYHFKPCKDVDVKYCYYKQLKRKEKECDQFKAENKHLSEKEEEARHYLKEAYNYKQALQDIKEITIISKTKQFVDMEDFWEKILQKCEVVKDAN